MSISSVPLWDTAWLGTLLVAIGDMLVIGGVLAAFVIYRSQDRSSKRQRRESALAHLHGVKAAMEDWYDSFFTTSYEGAAAERRAQLDFDSIMRGGIYYQNYRVPIEPVASLIQPSGDLWPFVPETVEAANVALFRMTIFNQLVQQQTDFNVLHAAELRRLVNEQRRPIALASMKISEDIHGAIDDAKWYWRLKKALEANIRELEEEPKTPSKQPEPPPNDDAVDVVPPGPAPSRGWLKATREWIQRHFLLAGLYFLAGIVAAVLLWVLWATFHTVTLLIPAAAVTLVLLLAGLVAIPAFLVPALHTIAEKIREGTKQTRFWGLLGTILASLGLVIAIAGLVVALIGLFRALNPNPPPISVVFKCRVQHCPHIVGIPDVIGATEADAMQILHDDHFSDVVPIQVLTTSEPNNIVFAEYPSNYSLRRATITIYVWTYGLG